MEETPKVGPKRVRPPGYHEANRIRKQLLRQTRRAQVIESLGGKCDCCGESTPVFLAVDHKNGGGSEHRKEFKSNRSAYWADILDNLDEFRILCHNCNHAVHFNEGKCPHQES